MKKLIPVFVAMFVGAGFSGVVSAADPAADHHATCKKHADEKKLAGDEAKKFIEKCVKEAGGKK